MNDVIQSTILIKQKFAKRLKEERKLAGYTQETFSIQARINRITYSGYEVGRSQPTIEGLVRIADTLNLSLDYLCCRTDDKKPFIPKESQTDILLRRIEALEAILIE